MFTNEQTVVNHTEKGTEGTPTTAETGLTWGRASNEGLTL